MKYIQITFSTPDDDNEGIGYQSVVRVSYSAIKQAKFDIFKYQVNEAATKFFEFLESNGEFDKK